jgi:FG-GAP repeat protein/putative Ig domain-containing protein
VINLRGLSTGGFRIDGANVGDELGSSVASAGDVNGDGLDDLLLGAPDASNGGRIGSGSTYVVYGTATPTGLDLRSGGSILRVDGAQVYYESGRSVASAGDFNGDGRPDIIIGSPSASYIGSRAGAAYIVFGFGEPELAYEPVTATVGSAANFAPKTFRHTGVASFAVAPPLPPGLDFAPRTGALTGTPAAGARPTRYTVTMTDATGTVTAPLDLTVTDFVAPVVRVTARSESVRRQKGAVSIRVTVDELCTIEASGAVRIAGSTRSVGLAGARANLGAEESRTLKLWLTSSALRRIEGALANHHRATASVVVHATDDFGNKTTKHLSIRLTR